MFSFFGQIAASFHLFQDGFSNLRESTKVPTRINHKINTAL